MKKIFVIALLMVMTLIMFGCGSNETSLSDITPDPEILFPETTFEVTDSEDGDTYQFVLKDGTSEMFDIYVEACRDGIFTDVTTDLENYYAAYSYDGLYKIAVTYFPGIEDRSNSNTYVYIDIRKVIEE